MLSKHSGLNNMNTLKCVNWESDEDAEDFDDPSCDLFYDNAVRAEQRELKLKELRKKERKILR